MATMPRHQSHGYSVTSAYIVGSEIKFAFMIDSNNAQQCQETEELKKRKIIGR
jgi:hypothetical protein